MTAHRPTIRRAITKAAIAQSDRKAAQAREAERIEEQRRAMYDAAPKVE